MRGIEDELVGKEREPPPWPCLLFSSLSLSLFLSVSFLLSFLLLILLSLQQVNFTIAHECSHIASNHFLTKSLLSVGGIIAAYESWESFMRRQPRPVARVSAVSSKEDLIKIYNE